MHLLKAQMARFIHTLRVVHHHGSCTRTVRISGLLSFYSYLSLYLYVTLLSFVTQIFLSKFHTVDTVYLRHIKLSYRPTDAH
jgi:hypothetical protein